LFGGKTPTEYNMAFLEANKTSLRHRFAVAESLSLLVPDPANTQALKLLLDSDFHAKGYKKLKEYTAVYVGAQRIFGNTPQVSELAKRMNQVFPYATIFMDPEERKIAEQEEVVDTKREESKDGKEGSDDVNSRP